jgi:hypothetical protein
MRAGAFDAPALFSAPRPYGFGSEPTQVTKMTRFGKGK